MEVIGGNYLLMGQFEDTVGSHMYYILGGQSSGWLLEVK